MPKIQSAMPSYQDGKRILFPHCENFGPGSYDPHQSLHIGVMRDGYIIPCESHIYSDAIVNGEIVQRTKTTKKYSSFPILIFEN